jgi:hypothetical protein
MNPMQTNYTKSLGSLRAVAEQPTEKHPRFLGKMTLQLHTLSYLWKQASDTQSDEVICNLAGWINHDTSGPFITVELSPKFVSKQQKLPANSNPFAELLGQEDEPSREPFKSRLHRWND